MMVRITVLWRVRKGVYARTEELSVRVKLLRVVHLPCLSFGILSLGRHIGSVGWWVRRHSPKVTITVQPPCSPP
jgi:hypothetical protein